MSYPSKVITFVETHKRLKMKTRTLLLTLGMSVTSLIATAQQTTAESNNFLQIEQVANSIDLLPPPPEAGSARFAYDEARYRWGKEQRDTPRGRQAIADAHLHNIAELFSEAFGHDITPETTPEIYRLVNGMREDAGDLSTRLAKRKYQRTRPFAYYGEPTAVPEHEKALSTNGSYPSGHTATGWAVALVLAEINPDRQDEILQRGFEIGESRVIVGFHFQSDVDAARVVASGVVARLHADPEFTRQLERAKAEFSRL